MTKVFSRPFGIEFEFGVDAYEDEVYDMASGVYSEVHSRRFAGREGWDAHEDCGGIELKTPPSTYRDWKEIRRVAHSIFDEYEANEEGDLGTHIHMDISDLSQQHRMQWYHMWTLYEPLMFNMVLRHRRSSMFCSPLLTPLRYNEVLQSSQLLAIEEFLEDGLTARRKSITSLTRHGTTEVRIHHCTTSINEIRKWIELLQVMLHSSRHFPMFTETRDMFTAINTFRRMNRRKQRDQLVRFIRTRVAPRYRRVLNTIDVRLNTYSG